MRDFGILNYILGIKVDYANNGVMLINQKHNICKMLEQFNLK